MYSKLLSATTVALAATLASAQTHSLCDPTKTDCPPDPAVGGIVDIDFRKGANDFFTLAQGTTLEYDPANGAVFTIDKDGQAPTITSSKYIFYGKVDVTLKAAKGVGIVSSFVLQSDDLDEIDWEWLGGDDGQVQSNYYSKGCTTNYGRGRFHALAASGEGAPQDNFITYTIEWTPTRLTWAVNGNVVRTLNAAGASGCDGYPQTPMQVKIGTWVGGGANSPPGTVQWAGGRTDFSQAPFKAYYQDIKITDYDGGSSAGSGATQYIYSDRSGSSDSIKVVSNGIQTGPKPGSFSTSSPSADPKPVASPVSAAGPAMTTMATAVPPLNYANSTSSSGPSPTGSSGPAVTTTSPVGLSAAGKTSFSLAGAAVVGLSLLMGLTL